MGEYDNAIAGGVGFWFFSESLGDGGDVLGVRKTVRARPSLGFRLVADDIINIREDFLELSTEELGDEGSREVKDEDLRKSSTLSIQMTLYADQLAFPFSEAFLLSSRTESVPWVKK